MSKKTQINNNSSLTGNLNKDYTFNAGEESYYHGVLINPLTNEFGVPFEEPKKFIYTVAEFQYNQQYNFFGYVAKVYHDPTLNTSDND